jgi:hypothetical protein
LDDLSNSAPAVRGYIIRKLEFQQQQLADAMDKALDQVIDDDVLRLIFTACHPVLVAGLDALDIAGADFRRNWPGLWSVKGSWTVTVADSGFTVDSELLESRPQS